MNACVGFTPMAVRRLALFRSPPEVDTMKIGLASTTLKLKIVPLSKVSSVVMPNASTSPKMLIARVTVSKFNLADPFASAETPGPDRSKTPLLKGASLTVS